MFSGGGCVLVVVLWTCVAWGLSTGNFEHTCLTRVWSQECLSSVSPLVCLTRAFLQERGDKSVVRIVFYKSMSEESQSRIKPRIPTQGCHTKVVLQECLRSKSVMPKSVLPEFPRIVLHDNCLTSSVSQEARSKLQERRAKSVSQQRHRDPNYVSYKRVLQEYDSKSVIEKLHYIIKSVLPGLYYHQSASVSLCVRSVSDQDCLTQSAIAGDESFSDDCHTEDAL